MSNIILASSASGAGTMTVQAPVTSSNQTMTLADASGTLFPFTQSTPVATTSGTTVVIATNIPSWAKRITVVLGAVSLSGTSFPLIQFGTGATPTYVVSGYLSTTDNYTNNAGPIGTSTAGFRIGSVASDAAAWSGLYVFINIGSNIWVGSLGGTERIVGVLLGGGTVTLASALTAIRLNTVNGTDTFDAGTVNIMYE